MNKDKHLTLNDRYEIYHSLEKRMSFKAIGSLLGKDCSTISKEIRGHIIFEKKVALTDPSMTAPTGCTVRTASPPVHPAPVSVITSVPHAESTAGATGHTEPYPVTCEKC